MATTLAKTFLIKSPQELTIPSSSFGLLTGSLAQQQQLLGIVTPIITNHNSGTFASRPVSPGPGDSYIVNAGTSSIGDVYECFRSGTWTLVSYDSSALAFAPTHYWSATETGGTTLYNSGTTSGSWDMTDSNSLTNISLGLLNESDYYVLTAATTGYFAASGSATTSNFATGSMTFSCVYQHNADTFAGNIFSWFANNTQHAIFMDSNGLICCKVGDSNGGQTTLNSHTTAIDALVSKTRKRLIHVTYNGASSPRIRLYVDGRQIATATGDAGGILYWGTQTPNSWVFGAKPGFSIGCVGFIGQGTFWDGRTLSAAEILEHAKRFSRKYKGK